jgi:two-component system cell cycle sensor histidine kinase/response regulator CckA
VFEPFYTTKARSQGTGLGLAIVYGIVKQHGGMIEAFSQPGLGTRIEILFPAVAAGKSPAPAPEAIAAPHGDETILLVEDENEVRRILVAVLTGLGYRVLEAADGQEALEMLQTALDPAPDLLVTDLAMPRLGGRALADLARGLRPQMRILCISGDAGDAGSTDESTVPAMALLHKPFTIEELTGKIREALDTPTG